MLLKKVEGSCLLWLMVYKCKRCPDSNNIPNAKVRTYICYGFAHKTLIRL